ncbi:MAG: hypothetical protein SGJ19_01165 [Planctomycetia bacterium]|nr:hypothetical protein [Planctomycetia bacterium]
MPWFTRGCHCEAPLILWKIRSHQAIPDVEVEAEVCSVFFMVQSMMSHGIEHAAQGVVQEAARENLVFAMSEYVERNLSEPQKRLRS